MPRNDTERIKQRIRDLRANIEHDLERLEQLEVKEQETERRNRTRRLILIGSVVTKQAGANEELRSQLWKWLDEGLARDFDRALFGLDPLPEQKNSCSPPMPLPANKEN